MTTGRRGGRASDKAGLRDMAMDENKTCPTCGGTGEVPVGEDEEPYMATDPPVSQAQRRAMGAAMSGKSNLGIPKSVGKEFIDADPGGHLPSKK